MENSLDLGFILFGKFWLDFFILLGYDRILWRVDINVFKKRIVVYVCNVSI